ncbi:MAG: S8 family serine peptidase, partial [Planctomycetota bacterium]
MKRQRAFFGLVSALVMLVAPTLAGTIDTGLQDVLELTQPDETISTLVFLTQRVDIDALNDSLTAQRATLQARHETVVRSLREMARGSQGTLHGYLKQLEQAGRIERFEAFWIVNCFRVDTVPAEIELLAQHPDVDTIYFNYPIEMITPETPEPGTASLNSDEGQSQRGPRTPEPGLYAVRAPEVWAMGFTGEGVLVSTLDTGVDGSHPALANRWRGVADPRYVGHPGWAFFDPVTNWTFPQDSGSHGTHTMGSVCGGAPGDEVGVAPGAQWIHAAVIDRSGLYDTCTDALLAFQWLIDPDEDPNTNWDVPAVCSNSWGIGSWHNVPPYNTPCDESFWSYLDACEAAGIVILFSAGNEGSDPNTLRRPADRATDDFRTCAVGGIDGNAGGPPWPMYTSSSRGPTYCTPDGTAAIKPEISAPAVSVRSSVPGGGYSSYSGTSMASPHVNGVVALMREACPDLTVQEVKEIMYLTALDQGTTGKDNDYGYGVVDAYEAVNMALDWCGDSPPRA